jgi:hypothetical protein
LGGVGGVAGSGAWELLLERGEELEKLRDGLQKQRDDTVTLHDQLVWQAFQQRLWLDKNWPDLDVALPSVPPNLNGVLPPPFAGPGGGVIV